MSQREVERLQRRWASLDEIEIDEAIKECSETRNGRRFLWWLLTIGKIGTQPFTSNALTTSFGCGELNVGQRILDRIIATDPAIYARMMKEQADESRDRNNQLGAVLGDAAGGYHPNGDADRNRDDDYGDDDNP